MKKSPTGMRITKNCKQCDSEFSVIPARKDTAMFCSILCHNRNIGENRRPHTEDHKKKIGLANSGVKVSKICLYCKEIFIVNTSHLNRKYCSQVCAWTNTQGEKNSRWKGGEENKLILTQRRRALRLSAEGSHTLNEWDDLKKLYNYMCICCKQQEPFVKLSVDHIIPLSKGGSDNIENIQPLCRSCNSIKHTKTFDYRLPIKDLMPCL